MTIFGFVTIGALMSAGAATGATVESIRIGLPDSAVTRVVVDLSAPATYKTFVLRDPSRLVVDVSAELGELGSVPATGAVQRIRVGLREGRVTRLVFDTADAFQLDRHFTLPPGDGRPDRIVFDLKGGLAVPRARNAPFTVIIDAGHGGKDPGALRGSLQEKHLTLGAAKELREILRKRKYRVVLTRETDVYIPLRRRVDISVQAKGDLFISLHADAVGRPHTRGLSAYTLSDKASDRLAAKLASDADAVDAALDVANFETYDEQVQNTMIELTRTGTRNLSAQFAESLVVSLGERGIRLLRRPHRQANFAVLRGFHIPSVLIEMGFVSNAKDAKLLASAKYRRQLMTAIADYVDRYFKTRGF
ncbi:MAG: N-acetylmuramoyl-L-alanine amidase [Alphaproteobacteria bacterium]|nr:N-acetylmuramoyl-L-alanine amidase [Alphaproteobacteria bacterium]